MLRAAICVLTIASMALSLPSCKKYDDPEPWKEYTEADFPECRVVSLKELKAMYKGKAVEVKEDLLIKAQVTTSDQAGNFYRSLYVQDSSAGIEVKVGKTGLYNDYKPGQWLLIKCKGLVLGSYNGMVQLGYESTNPEYDNAYIDVQLIIDNHIFRGKVDAPVKPLIITSGNDLKKEENMGKLCRVEGLSYRNRIFCILYDKDGGRLFLDEKAKDNHGIDTWALSKAGFDQYMKSGNVKHPEIYPTAAVSVSQFFSLGGVDLQVRTSGYAKFADALLSGDLEKGVPDVTAVSSRGKVVLTGILSRYKDNIQFTLIDLSCVEVK